MASHVTATRKRVSFLNCVVISRLRHIHHAQICCVHVLDHKAPCETSCTTRHPASEALRSSSHASVRSNCSAKHKHHNARAIEACTATAASGHTYNVPSDAAKRSVRAATANVTCGSNRALFESRCMHCMHTGKAMRVRTAQAPCCASQSPCVRGRQTHLACGGSG